MDARQTRSAEKEREKQKTKNWKPYMTMNERMNE